MADEQIIVDIQVDDKEVLHAEKSIDKLTDSIEKLGKEIKDARENNKKYKKTIADLDKQYDEGTLSAEDHKKQTKLLGEEIVKNNKKIADSTVVMQKQKRERTANIKLINSEINSRDRLRQKVALLTKEYNELNIETKEGRDRSKQLQKELKELNEQLNEGSLAAGNFKDNIGNYPKASEGAIVSLNQLGDGMDAVGGSSANAVGSIRQMGQAFKALLLNPVIIALVAIVAGLSALFSAFKRSETGAKVLSKANAALKGSFAVLTRFVDDFSKAAPDAFEKGADGTKGFWKALKENVVNRLEGVVNLVKAVGEGLSALWSGTAEDIEKAGKKAKNALIAITTGLDEKQFDSIIDKMKEMSGVAILITQAFINLEEAQRANRSAVRFLQKDIAVLNAEFERLGEIAGDDTRNMQEMREAAIQAGEAAANLAAKQVKLSKARLSLINQEVATRRLAGEQIEDLLDEQAEAEVALTEARSQSAIAQQKILIEQRKIERDIFEQNLDILIDVGDRIKTEQERQIQNESFSLAKRRELLEASRAALTANFDEIKKEYELYGVTAQQINEVINASDAKQANEKLKALGLNEIANNRLREIILERRQAELDFNDLSKDLSDEEIARKSDANERIKEINEDAILDQIENAEELKNKLIEFEKARVRIILEDETLLAEEREAIILDSEVRIQEIENEFSEQKKEKEAEDREERQEFIEEFFDDLIKTTLRFAGEEAAIFAGIAQGIAKSFEDGKISAESALMGVSVASNAVFDGISARRAQDLNETEAARTKELELAGDSQEAIDNINQFYDKKSAELKLKQFKADKAKAIIDISIQTAVAIVKALPNVALSIAMGVLGGVQAGIVAAKKPPQFAEGINDIVGIGGSHASGNDVDVYGYSGGQSQYFGKVERGEAMPVIRKSAVNDYQVAKLNGKFSQKKGYYQDGTQDITQTQPQNNELFIANMVDAFSNVQIVAKIEDITKEARKKVQIVDNSKV